MHAFTGLSSSCAAHNPLHPRSPPSQPSAATHQPTLFSRSLPTHRHVIVSEKRNKKATHLTTAGVPFPFSSREQYERSLRQPLGREWNTGASHKALVAPAVKVAKGAVIDPIAMHRKAAPKERGGGAKR